MSSYDRERERYSPSLSRSQVAAPPQQPTLSDQLQQARRELFAKSQRLQFLEKTQQQRLQTEAECQQRRDTMMWVQFGITMFILAIIIFGLIYICMQKSNKNEKMTSANTLSAGASSLAPVSTITKLAAPPPTQLLF